MDANTTQLLVITDYSHNPEKVAEFERRQEAQKAAMLEEGTGSTWGWLVSKASSVKTYIGEKASKAGTFVCETASNVVAGVRSLATRLFERKIVPAEGVQNLMKADADESAKAAAGKADVQQKAQAMHACKAEVERLEKMLADAKAAHESAEAKYEFADAVQLFTDEGSEIARAELIDGIEKEIEAQQDKQFEHQKKAYDNETAMRELAEEVAKLDRERTHEEWMYERCIADLESEQKKLESVESGLMEQIALRIEYATSDQKDMVERMKPRNQAERNLYKAALGSGEKTCQKEVDQRIKELTQQRNQLLAEVDKAQKYVTGYHQRVINAAADLANAEAKMQLRADAVEIHRAAAEGAAQRKEEHEALLKRYQPESEEGGQTRSSTDTSELGEALKRLRSPDTSEQEVELPVIIQDRTPVLSPITMPTYKRQTSEGSESGYSTAGSDKETSLSSPGVVTDVKGATSTEKGEVDDDEDDDDMGFGLFD